MDDPTPTTMPSSATISPLRATEISSLTDTQEIVLSLLSLFSASLSVMGSVMIIFLVLVNTRKTPYKRILLGLSACDIIASTTYAISTFLLPQATSQRLWATGNETSCSFLGFLVQFAFSAIWYNGCLSLYYLLTIRFNIKTKRFATRVEPFVHILCVGYNFITALLGLLMGYYNEAELGMICWIAEYPKDCELTDTCTGHIIGWIYGGLPFLIVLLLIGVSNLVIYCFVRRTIHKGRNRGRRSSTRGSIQSQQRRIRAVSVQAFLYVGSFFLAYIWAFILKVLESIGYEAQNEATIYPILVLQSLFLPLQGFFNLCVYTRPNYLRVRQEYPNESRLWVLRYAWFRETRYQPTVTANATATAVAVVAAGSSSFGNNSRQYIVGLGRPTGGGGGRRVMGSRLLSLDASGLSNLSNSGMESMSVAERGTSREVSTSTNLAGTGIIEGGEGEPQQPGSGTIGIGAGCAGGESGGAASSTSCENVGDAEKQSTNTVSAPLLFDASTMRLRASAEFSAAFSKNHNLLLRDAKRTHPLSILLQEEELQLEKDHQSQKQQQEQHHGHENHHSSSTLPQQSPSIHPQPSLSSSNSHNEQKVEVGAATHGGTGATAVASLHPVHTHEAVSGPTKNGNSSNYSPRLPPTTIRQVPLNDIIDIHDPNFNDCNDGLSSLGDDDDHD